MEEHVRRRLVHITVTVCLAGKVLAVKVSTSTNEYT